jgi:hypothetical protein
MIRIANGAGFLGDNLDAPRLLVERAEVDYLTLEYLAELTMSILAAQREKYPQAGYASDFLEVCQSLLPAVHAQEQLKLVTNAGGVNPAGCAAAVAGRLHEAGLGELPIGVVTGDDLIGRLDQIQADGWRFENLETGQPLAELRQPIVCANAYLGAQPIAQALAADARMVIAGRVADASLTVGPAAHAFDWAWDDWDRLAGASVAGHLIECGAQVTGGLSSRWQELNLAEVGYPIAEVDSDGAAVITKPPGTGGIVDRATVIEQLVYEIGDPAHYLTPDVDVDFTTVEVQQEGPDRVLVRGATGRPAPECYKVSLAYRAGYAASGMLLVYGSDCVAKARACGEMVLQRVRRAGFVLEQSLIEVLGAGDAVPGERIWPAEETPLAGSTGVGQFPRREVVLRIAVRDRRREAVARFAKELAPLITSGPPGVAGYATGRPPVRPVLAFWPTLAPKSAITPRVEVRLAAEWLAGA